MRGSDEQTGSLFSYVDLEERIPARHPLRKILAIVQRGADGARCRVRQALRARRPSVDPARAAAARVLMQMLFSIRSETAADGAVAVQPAVSLVRRARHRRGRCGSRRCSRRTATGC